MQHEGSEELSDFICDGIEGSFEVTARAEIKNLQKRMRRKKATKLKKKKKNIKRSGEKNEKEKGKKIMRKGLKINKNYWREKRAVTNEEVEALVDNVMKMLRGEEKVECKLSLPTLDKPLYVVESEPDDVPIDLAYHTLWNALIRVESELNCERKRVDKLLLEKLELRELVNYEAMNNLGCVCKRRAGEEAWAELLTKKFEL